MAQDTDASAAPNAIGRIIDAAARLATSWIGLVTAYLAAITTVGVAWQHLPEPLRMLSPWMRATAVFSLPVLLVIFHGIPAILDQRRKKQLTQITGEPPQPGYFSLRPRENDETFARMDGEHQRILQWIEQRRGLLYLTGLSGTGKSSILSAWVVPHLVKEQKTHIIRLRGYQNPLATLRHEMLQPGLIWQKPPTEVLAMAMRPLLERACRNIRPRRLVIVFDQFEEFVILQNLELQQQFVQLLSSLHDDPIEELTLLLVLRSDYIESLEKLQLPKLVQDTNWTGVPQFTERIAREFLRLSGLEMEERLLRDVLREAGEIEGTKGLIRPITINLCGLVLARFVTGLPGGFRPGALIPGFLRESILLPELQDLAPRVIPHLITNQVTKQPQTISELAKNMSVEPATVRGCLRRLGQSDRGIVRPLDANQEVWEISHDFLVPLLDSIVARWRISFWKRIRVWLPWMTVAAVVLAAVLLSSWKQDPIVELTGLGWTVTPTQSGLQLEINSIPPAKSIEALQRIRRAFSMRLYTIDPSISEWRDVKNLIALEISHSQVSDVGAFRGLKALTTLDLSGTQVSDVRPLRDLKALTTLNLGLTQVRDVGALQDLKALTTLYLGGTQVSDVAALRDLKALTTLYLGGTQVSDVGPLRDLKALTTLYLGGTQVSDVGPLRDLKALTTLDLGGTQVSDVRPLRDLKALTTLDLSFTQVSDVGTLRDLKALPNLVLRGTQVSDVAALWDLKALETLDLSGTQVSDVGALRNLKALKTLNLSGTQVSDVAALRDLKALNTLELNGTKVSHMSIETLKHDLPNTFIFP